ncbi:ArsR family transcriptional regulator [Haloplanus rubicundus]|uniref:ArsR family transcriptional regulator n=1 Tax=Haloplanus rubicundus TaxID=1547898 RepID=A0A345EEI6_9EURY|nr:helix-turn-helix domain-containing protein [Haloplanus rubicundus]AXG07193.1 ArsR family transcriptional regulator [Haloplanus rubicundus]AXG10608.1 ArsR family transcriptional regulator [Haloplanus rubicundus]
MAIATPPRVERSPDETTVADADEVQAILYALQDDGCRAVLDATGEASMSANELADACDLPLSTTYRKLDTLTETGLLAERTRLCPDGKHTSEYVRAVDEILVDADAGFELTVTRRDPTDRDVR